MTSVGGSRLTNGLQMLGILALLVSIFILVAAAGQLGHNRKQMVLAGDVLQVLNELKQLTSGQRPVTGISDEMAGVLAYGDVLTSDIRSDQGSGFFGKENLELSLAKTSLIQSWKSVKTAVASTNENVNDTTTGISQIDGANVRTAWEEQLENYSALRESFNGVFAAISQDTLSADLLAANSQMLATLKNIDFILGNRDSLNPIAYNRLLRGRFSSLQSEVTKLISLTTTDSGGVLIGYESKQLLNSFAMQAKQFRLVPIDNAVSATALITQGQPGELTSELIDALDSAENYRQLLDRVSHQNRTAILFAIAALCLALICLLLSQWRNWRNQFAGGTANSDDLELLRSELTAIANGDLNVRASQQSSTSLSAIAQASNHTVEMLTGLVRLFRRAGNRLNELSGSQQFLAKRWIKSELQRREQLELVSRQLDLQSHSIDQLLKMESSVASSEQVSEQLENRPDVSNRSLVQELLSNLSACRDIAGIGNAADGYSDTKKNNLTGEGLLRMRQRMHELTGSISAVRLAAEQARLQVLNTSLQMTAYAGGSEIDDQSELVEDMQNISNQLASSAAGAERMSSALADELQYYVEAFASDKQELVNHFDQLQESVSKYLDKSPDAGLNEDSDGSLDTALESDNRQAIAEVLESVEQQQMVLQQLVAELNSGSQMVSDGDAIELLDQIAEIQKVSASLARSAEMYGSTSIE